MKLMDLSQERCVVLVRCRHRAHDPVIDIWLRRIEEFFERRDFPLAQPADLTVGEAAEQQIHFTRAAMPSAKQKPPLADFGVSRLRFIHIVKRQKPGLAGRG